MKSETMLKGAVGIEPRAYENRMDLVEARLDENIEYIGEKAFYNCKNLRRVEIPASCTRIDANAFSKCENLKWVQFSVFGKRINFHPKAFYKSGLKEIRLPATCIGTNPFDMGMFSNVLYPSYYRMDRLHKYPFEREKLAGQKAERKIYVYYDYHFDGYFVAKIEGTWIDRRLVLPETYGEKYIVGISNEAFKDWDFESVILPFTCRYIGEGAFENCTLLQHIGVYFDPKELHIHPKAFKNCPHMNMDKIKFYDVKNMEESEEWVEPTIDELEVITYRDGYELWAYHGKAKHIKLPAMIGERKLYRINPGAFSCSQIENMEIPETCETICYEAFSGCWKLKTVMLSKKTNVQQNVFQECGLVELVYTDEEE